MDERTDQRCYNGESRDISFTCHCICLFDHDVRRRKGKHRNCNQNDYGQSSFFYSSTCMYVVTSTCLHFRFFHHNLSSSSMKITC